MSVVPSPLDRIMRVTYRTTLLAALIVLIVPSGSSVGSARSPVSRPDLYGVLIVLDGFRPDYLQLAPMQHLRALMRSGASYTRAWVGQLETQTPTGHATLVTGVYPQKHGIMGFGWRDPTGQNFSWMPTDLRELDAGAMENLIESAGVPTISDLVHRTFPGAKSVSLSGEKYYAADAMGTGADYVVYGARVGKRGEHGMTATPIGRHVPPESTQYREASFKGPAYPEVQDQFVAQLAIRFLRTVRPRLMLINLPGTDIEGHLTGGVIDRHDMSRLAAGVDKAIGAVVAAYRRAGLYDRTVFVVTADHGMVPNTHIVPLKAMYAAVRATGASWLEDDFLTTGGYVYLRDPARAAGVAAQLAVQRFPGVEGALYKVSDGSAASCRAESTTAQALGPALTRAYLDLCDTIAAPSGPDVVLPYAEDTMGLTVAGQRHWGNHGGLSWGTQQIPLVMSGPGVRHIVSRFPAQLVDVAPTIERLLGVSVPSGVDGVVLADALDRAGPLEVTAQHKVAPGRSGDVRALQDHSLAQGSVAVAP